MKYRRFLASILCGLMVFTNTGVQAFAADDTTTSDFTATSSILGNELIVSIPDNITLSKSNDNFTGSSVVTAYGTTRPTAVLSVETDSQITYTNQYKTDIEVNADVTFGTDGLAEWTASELKDNIDSDTKKSYTVTATVPMSDIDYIGEYKSTVVFNISLSDTSAVTTYYMGYAYTDSTSVNYDNQCDIAYDILPQADTVAELKEFSTDKDAIEAKGYDAVIESSDTNLVIPSTVGGYEVVGISLDTFFANERIATYVSDIEVPSSVTGVELSDTTSSESTTVVTCNNVRTAVNLSKKLPSAAKIRFKFEANGKRDYTEFFTYYTDSSGTYVAGFSDYGCSTLKSYGADSTVEITLPVTYQGKPITGVRMRNDVSLLLDDGSPEQVWIFPDSYTVCQGFWNNSRISDDNPCTKLTGVIFNEGLESISADAFRGCMGLTSITIPASVTSIGKYAFYGLTNLTSVTFEEGFNGLFNSSTSTYNVFAKTGITEVTFPSSMTKFNCSAFGNKNDEILVRRIIWNTNHDVPIVESSDYLRRQIVFNDGVYIGVGSSQVPAVAQSDDGITAVVSSDVAANAFDTNEKYAYKHIIIQSGVTSIGEKAFKNNTTAETISLPDTITTMGRMAFSGCTANFGTYDLRNVTSYNGDDGIFYHGTFDKLIVTSKQLSSKIIQGAIIEDLYIDYDGTAILKRNATDSCTITNVYFSGSEDDWVRFRSDSGGNEPLTNANITFNATMP